MTNLILDGLKNSFWICAIIKQTEEQIIQSSIFDCIEALERNYQIKNKDLYKLALGTLDILNEQYKGLTGKLCIKDLDVLNYYSRLWEF